MREGERGGGGREKEKRRGPVKHGQFEYSSHEEYPMPFSFNEMECFCFIKGKMRTGSNSF